MEHDRLKKTPMVSAYRKAHMNACTRPRACIHTHKYIHTQPPKAQNSPWRPWPSLSPQPATKLDPKDRTQLSIHGIAQAPHQGPLLHPCTIPCMIPSPPPLTNSLIACSSPSPVYTYCSSIRDPTLSHTYLPTSSRTF